MKRRFFIASAGVVGVGVSTGFAATSSLLTSSAPWHFVRDLDVEFTEPMDNFAKDLRYHLRDLSNCEKIVQSMVLPKKIISQDLSKGLITYQNAASNFITISKQNEEVSISIYHQLPQG